LDEVPQRVRYLSNMEIKISFLNTLALLTILTTPAYSFGSERLSSAYPYIPAIESAIRFYPAVPKEIVLGIIHFESRGKINALSPKGAMGLMQIMPGTVDFVHHLMKVRRAELNPWDPEDNILMGVAYLDWLLKRYNGNSRLALIGYNAGPRIADLARKADRRLIRETRVYVANVLNYSSGNYPLKDVRVKSVVRVTSHTPSRFIFIPLKQGNTVSRIAQIYTGNGNNYQNSGIQIVSISNPAQLITKTDHNLRRLQINQLVRIDISLLKNQPSRTPA